MATILIAEDDNDIRTAYTFALSRAGHKVIEAVNGGEAIQLLESAPPDLIVLDMLMPGMSGLDFLRQAQVAVRYPNTKVIAFSNIDNPRVIADAKALGATDYLVKVNVTPHQMVGMVQGYLSD